MNFEINVAIFHVLYANKVRTFSSLYCLLRHQIDKFKKILNLFDMIIHYYEYLIHYFWRKLAAYVLSKLRFTSISYFLSLVLKMKDSVRPYT